ncbi:MAG: hypothetical protein M3081_09320, partial [Gemmatimonadota bacterium]|nr:hypothetical protein [Gemmatimonadota bacterium]
MPDRAPSTRARTGADTAALVLPRAIEARSIGLASMGGRASTIAFDPQTPSTYYAGFGTGGVMKTTDNGVT